MSFTASRRKFIYLGETIAKLSFRKTDSIVGLVFSADDYGLVFFFCSKHFPGISPNDLDDWAKVQAPKPPELKAVTLDPQATALLVLDFVKQTCNTERRPRCLTSVPQVQSLLKLARGKGVAVVHSITTAATPADIP